jgi:hypothetical protein
VQHDPTIRFSAESGLVGPGNILELPFLVRTNPDELIARDGTPSVQAMRNRRALTMMGNMGGLRLCWLTCWHWALWAEYPMSDGWPRPCANG